MHLFGMISKQRCFFWFLLSLSLGAHAVPPPKNEPEIKKAIARARDYLNRTPILDMGSLMLKMKLTPELLSTTEIPQNDAFRRLFGRAYAVHDLDIERSHGLKSSTDVKNLIEANNLKHNNYFYTVSKKYQKALVDPSDDILIKSLYCDISGYDGVDWNILQRLRDNAGGYYDTHHLVGLLLVEANKCYDQKKINIAKRQVIKDIVAAQHKSAKVIGDTFSDIFAERLVCLYWAKAQHLVDPRWIDIILKAQRDDGGWAGSVILKNSGTHPSSLAALALKYFIAKNDDEYYFYRR